MDEKPFRIFVVEDDEWYNRLLVHNLSLNPDYEIESFTTGKDCLDSLYKLPDVITLDYRLPDIKGLEMLKKIKAENEDIQVILISEQSEIEVVVELLKFGAYDYIVKSDDIRERLLNTVQNIRKGVRLKREVISLRSEVKKKYSYQKTIVGSSPATKKNIQSYRKGHTNRDYRYYNRRNRNRKRVGSQSYSLQFIAFRQTFCGSECGSHPTRFNRKRTFWI